MEDKKSFIVYTEWGDDFEALTMEERGLLITAIFNFHRNGDVEDFNDRTLNVIFRRYVNIFTQDYEKWLNICEKRSLAGAKGGKAKATKSKQMVANGSKCKQKVASVADTVTDTDTVTDNDTDIKKEIVKEKKSKDEKKSFGYFNNVFLTEKEYIALQEDFPLDYDNWIDKASNYFESTGKGKKYKSHFATIRKWARDSGVKTTTDRAKEFSEADKFFSGIEKQRSYRGNQENYLTDEIFEN